MVFTSDNNELHYEMSGTGEIPVLLLHGWGGSTESWLPVWRDLGEYRRLINIDFPGFGQSPEPSDAWGVGDYADFLLAFLDGLGETRIDVIAHSFGGRVALVMNQKRPDLIRKQVLTGAAGLRKPPESGAAKTPRGMKGLYDNALTHQLLGDKAIEKIRNFVRSRFGSEDYKNATPRMREVFQKVVNEDLSYCLDGIRASTLLLWGRNDTATPLWMGQEMERRIPDAALVIFENAGHFAYLEQYQRFIAIIKNFLVG